MRGWFGYTGVSGIALYFPLVLLFTSLFAIPLARQRFFYAAFFAGFQVVGVTLHFLDNVLLLNLALKPAQCIFKRFAFLYANLCQEQTPPNRPSSGNYKFIENLRESTVGINLSFGQSGEIFPVFLRLEATRSPNPNKIPATGENPAGPT